jgi:hypothetical protein
MARLLRSALRPGVVECENDPVMARVVETLAETVLDRVRMVVANNSARSSFSVVSGGDLLALDADLNVLHRWKWPAGSLDRGLGRAGLGWHASLPSRGLALISGPDAVWLLGEAGQTIWAYSHTAWQGNFESGCTWFDAAGEPYAVIPAASYDHCLVIRFDLESGAPLAEVAIDAAPAGIHPVHHPDGWVGLSEGEGQDAARAWWVRSATSPGGPCRIEVRDAGWDDWVVSDVHPSGMAIITTPHSGRALAVRSFSDLEVLLSADPPGDDEFWADTACFAGEGVIVGKLEGASERLVAIDLNGETHDLAQQEEGWLIPGANYTWLAATGRTIRRCRLALSYQQQYEW